MGKEKYYQYFVEGEDEKKLVDVLKSDMKLIVSGKSQVFNVTQQKLTRLRVMNLKPGTTVVLIFDADAGNLQILKDNINFLHKEKVVSEVICVIQVRNLEDELIRCCNIRQIKELLGSKSEKDHLPELWRRRAEHYYSEFARAEKGAELWRKGDLEGYGQLVFESGKSSIYSYECGCDELKKLYEIMWNTDGIYGGRFSGAGFKGCCMALVDPEKVEDIKAKVTEEYLKAFPKLEGRYSAYVCESADGVRL